MRPEHETAAKQASWLHDRALARPQQIHVTASAPDARRTRCVTLTSCAKRVAGPWRARVGYAGLSAHHREGDGTTPLGTFAIGPVLYGIAADPGVKLRYHRLTCGDWWDEDPASPAYNTFEHVACGATPPFGGASEALWKATRRVQLFRGDRVQRGTGRAGPRLRRCSCT